MRRKGSARVPQDELPPSVKVLHGLVELDRVVRPGDVVVFDLDDTLFDECEFTLSGNMAVGGELQRRFGTDAAGCVERMDSAVAERRNHFDAMEAWLREHELHDPALVKELVTLHRLHRPLSLPLRPGWREWVSGQRCKGVRFGLITDGRSVTQRNKLRALGIGEWFDEDAVWISEERGVGKTTPAPFAHIMTMCPVEDCAAAGIDAARYHYIGDNPAKDFAVANSLGWNTVCVADPGRNIHPQDWPAFAPTRLPAHFLTL